MLEIGRLGSRVRLPANAALCVAPRIRKGSEIENCRLEGHFEARDGLRKKIKACLDHCTMYLPRSASGRF